MPAFSYDYSISLVRPLSSLGIRTAFSRQADFSKMSKDKVHIDDVLHKTHITVTKEGTEAAAVTAVMGNATSVAPTPMVTKKVYLNRPFLYAILDTATGFPLFLGVVNHMS